MIALTGHEDFSNSVQLIGQGAKGTKCLGKKEFFKVRYVQSLGSRVDACDSNNVVGFDSNTTINTLTCKLV